MKQTLQFLFVLQVNRLWQEGDQESATKAAKEAWRWSIAGLLCGILSYMAYTILGVVYYQRLLKNYDW